MTVQEIGAEFVRSDDLKLNIVKDIGHRTVAMFAVTDTPSGEALQLAGTGTLVAIGEQQYILTAAHVWFEKLRRAPKLALTITDRISHRFVIETAAISAHTLPRPSVWNEWGPDLALLRIPSERLGTINAYLSFADLVSHSGILQIEHVQTHVLMGAPYEFATFVEDTHASVQMNGFFACDVEEQIRGDFDYLDLKANLKNVGIPQNFGGVSGGGLWRTCLYWSKEARIDWLCQLVGVSFYEIPAGPTIHNIRCHGAEAIRRLLAVAGEQSSHV